MYQYDWQSGRITMNWLAPGVGLARFHEDARVVPGPYDAVVTVYIQDGEYELMGFIGECPKLSEFKEFYGYLASLGYKGGRRRFKGKSNAH